MAEVGTGIVVQKFGGTSVATPEAREQAARKAIEARYRGQFPVLVVSAIGRKGAPYHTDTLIELGREIDPDIEPRELDLLMACGEIISTVVMAATIKAMSRLETVALTGGQAGITTDGVFGKARIVSVNPSQILSSVRERKIPIIAGFQGVSREDSEPGKPHTHGAITTLGRGGSDTTAAAVAAALEADACEIYTDVDGVMTADPRIVPEARTLRTVSYAEICEMAHQGARVLHPRCAEIAMEHRIPLWVKNTFSDSPGTLITETAQEERTSPVTGVVNSGPVAHVTLAIAEEEDRAQVALELYRLLATADISIYFLSATAETISFVVDRDRLRNLRDVLNGVVIPVEHDGRLRFYVVCADPRSPVFAVQERILTREGRAFHTQVVQVEIGENARIVSLIGSGMQNTVGIMARVARTLNDAGVTVQQMADSKISLSCLVSEEQMVTAVRALHEEFIEHGQ